MYGIYPIRVMCEAGVTAAQLEAVVNGVQEVLWLAGVDGEISVENYGVWRHLSWREQNGALVPFSSVDWYIAEGWRESRKANRVNAGKILKLLEEEPWQKSETHYDVFVLYTDAYSGDPDSNYLIGLTAPMICTVISVHRFLGLNLRLQEECVKTLAMHEVGHMFGLPSQTRKQHIEKKLGWHCTNRCVMRQGMTAPNDWVAMTNDRLIHGPYCDECRRELTSTFH